MFEVDIRPFVETDREPLRSLFRRAGEGAPSATLWGDESSEADVYLVPYMDHEPSSLLIAVVNGELAGYLAGSIGGTSLPNEDARIETAIRNHRLMRRFSVLRFMGRALLDTAGQKFRGEARAGELDDPRWPAHLHINLVPEARGKGAGAALMSSWFDRLSLTGTPGCYLQTQVENVRAVRFFETMGFSKLGPTPVVPGVRHNGRRLHQQTMVWSL